MVSTAAPAADQAEELKKQGNLHYQNKRFEKAIEMYSSAIAIDASNPAIYTNRSHAQFQLENYGSALMDATEALKINPSFIKGYYRRAHAFIALNQLTKAIKDLEKLSTLVPKDVKVANMLKRCSEHLMKSSMRCALSQSPSVKSPFDMLDIKSQLPSSYSGPKIDLKHITHDTVMQVIDHFKQGKSLHHTQISKIKIAAVEYFKQQPNIVRLDAPSADGAKMTICGDVHGQFYDFINIFEINGYPSEKNIYLFNGDFVDRGAWSLEIILTMLLFKLLYPHHFFMNRGNHEVHSLNQMYGFEGEVYHKYAGSVGKLMYQTFTLLFESLPLATIVGDRIFVTHGGVPCDGGVTLEEINAVDRFGQPPAEGIMCDLLWADPTEQFGLQPSPRGISNLFGPDVTERFLKKNKLSMIVRSHEMKLEGHEYHHGGQCVTIFSAPNYCDSMNNKGAFIHVDSDANISIEQFGHVPHPDVNPAQYSSIMNNYF